MRISNSEIQVFKRCKRRWYFNYYLQLKPNIDSATGAAPIGTRIHKVLDQYYNAKLNGASDDMARALAMRYHGTLVAYDVEVGRASLDDKKYTSEIELTTLMLEGYFDWLQETGADEGLRVVASETPVEVDIEVDGTPVTVMGLLDLRLYRELDGAHLFIDDKTCMEMTSFSKWSHLNEQFKTYDWLLSHATGEHTDGGMFNLLRKVKRTSRATPPFHGRIEVRHSDKEMESFDQTLHGEIRDIIRLRRALDAGSAGDLMGRIYPTPTRDCSWECPYFQVCPMVDRADGSAGRMIELTMHPADPYERYDISREE